MRVIETELVVQKKIKYLEFSKNDSQYGQLAGASISFRKR